MKHTESVWTVKRFKSTEDTCNHMIQSYANDDGRPVDVCQVYPISDDGQDGGESHYNALLIAAAPELLEALNNLLNWGRDHLSPVHNPEAHDLLIAAHNAIAKATGTK